MPLSSHDDNDLAAQIPSQLEAASYVPTQYQPESSIDEADNDDEIDHDQPESGLLEDNQVSEENYNDPDSDWSDPTPHPNRPSRMAGETLSIPVRGFNIEDYGPSPEFGFED